MLTTAEYINELIQQKNKLADTLVLKGVSADKTEKYNSLINKVNSIIEVKGEEITLNNELEDKNAALRFEYPNDITKQISTKLSSKNMLNPTLWPTAETSSGVTVQYLPDEDCFLLNGTTTKTDGVSVGIKKLPNIPLDKGKYTASATYVSGTVSPENRAVFYIGAKDDPTASTSVNWMATKLNMSNTSSTADSRNYLMQYWFYWYGDITFTDYKVKLQFEKSSRASKYTTFVSDFSNSKLYKYGKNLFDKSLVQTNEYADMGAFNVILVETLENGWILQGKDGNQTGNGAYANGWFRPTYAAVTNDSKGIQAVIDDTYTLSYDITLLEKTYLDSTYPFSARIWFTPSGNAPSKDYTLEIGIKKHIVLTVTASRNEFIFPVISLNSCKLKIENIQIELGKPLNNDYVEYIPYIEYTADSEGNVTGIQSLNPTTTLITDGSTIISEATGVYKHILPSADKNCFIKVWQPVAEESE